MSQPDPPNPVSSVPARSSAPTLVRRLGPLDGAAIVVSNVIGGGIFFVPALVAQGAPHPWAMLGVWLAGGLLAFAGAMAYAELAALRPYAGGEYVYLRDAYGPMAAFLTGWTSFVAGFSGAIAASAVAMAGILGRFIPVAADTTPLVSIPLVFVSLTVSPRAVVALAAVAALSAIHIAGLWPGRIVQNLLAGFKVAALMAVVAFGFSLGRGTMANYSVGGDVAVTSWLFALIPVMFSYSGWNAAAYVAEEVRNPGRNVPRALALGTVTVVVVYMLLNMLYLYAMPIDELARQEANVGTVAVERLFGTGVAGAWAAASVVMIAASVSAMVLVGPRVYFAMARDGLFFKAATRVHARFRTPAVAIIAQGVWSGLLVLSGTFDQLVQYTGFAVVLFAGIAVLALFVLRWKHPADVRPFSAWGYPVAPLFFVVASLLIVVNAIRESPGPSGAGLLIIGAGMPVYLVMRARRSVRAAEGAPEPRA